MNDKEKLNDKAREIANTPPEDFPSYEEIEEAGIADETAAPADAERREALKKEDS